MHSMVQNSKCWREKESRAEDTKCQWHRMVVVGLLISDKVARDILSEQKTLKEGLVLLMSGYQMTVEVGEKS